MFMAASHLRLLLCELEGTTDEKMPPTTMYFNSKSAIAIGMNYKDTKHTRHIMQQYHYVRENIANNCFSTKWICNKIQIADIGTKLNDGPKHKVLAEIVMIKVKDQKELVQEGW